MSKRNCVALLSTTTQCSNRLQKFQQEADPTCSQTDTTPNVSVAKVFFQPSVIGTSASGIHVIPFRAPSVMHFHVLLCLHFFQRMLSGFGSSRDGFQCGFGTPSEPLYFISFPCHCRTATPCHRDAPCQKNILPGIWPTCRTSTWTEGRHIGYIVCVVRAKVEIWHLTRPLSSHFSQHGAAALHPPECLRGRRAGSRAQHICVLL